MLPMRVELLVGFLPAATVGVFGSYLSVRLTVWCADGRVSSRSSHPLYVLVCWVSSQIC